MILKQIPQATLDKIFPDHQINFDALPLKAVRILLTASLFAIAHMQYYSCENGGEVSVFLGGALYSALIESGEPLTTTMILHTIWNTFAPYLNQLI